MHFFCLLLFFFLTNNSDLKRNETFEILKMCGSNFNQLRCRTTACFLQELQTLQFIFTCADDGSSGQRNVYNVSLTTFALAVIFIITLGFWKQYLHNTGKYRNPQAEAVCNIVIWRNNPPDAARTSALANFFEFVRGTREHHHYKLATFTNCENMLKQKKTAHE